MKLILIIIIVIVSLLQLLASNVNCSQAKIMFLVPKNAQQEQQLNNNLESIFQSNKLIRGWQIEANVKTRFYFFIHTLLPISHKQVYYIFFTLNSSSCDDYMNSTYLPISIQYKDTATLKRMHRIEIEFSLKHTYANSYYICFSQNEEDKELSFDHQGSHLALTTYESIFPLSVKLIFYTVLVLLNATFNGLNLGLMSLSVEELKLVVKTSESAMKRQCAINILPLRKKGNFLLCSILLSITMTSASSVLILDDLIQGFLAGLISTFILCIIGEIIPQALFSKYPLEIGSYTRRLTQFFIFLTCPLSFPLSRIVDYVLGTELPREYNRDSIKELIKKSIGLKEHQCKIINGALDLKHKQVDGVMTQLNDVFMLQQNELLNFETIVRIYNSGFSRIPVYNRQRNDIVGIIHIKDLMITDPNDELSVRKVLDLFKRNVTYCYRTDNLYKMFDIFRRGMSHMAFVIDVIQNDHTDPYYECVGIITLQDVIGQLLGLYSTTVANVNKKSKGVEYLSKMIESSSITHEYLHHDGISNSSSSFISFSKIINSQTKLVILQILSTVEPFKCEFIEMNILEKLVNNRENFEFKFLNSQAKNDSYYLYEYNKPCDYFILLVEGSFIVDCGQEKIESFAKSFEYFGTKSLIGNNEKGVDDVLARNQNNYPLYVPEFSLRVDNNGQQLKISKNSFISISYFKINRKAWLNAVKATQLQKTARSLAV